jgi:hypothetical protein
VWKEDSYFPGYGFRRIWKAGVRTRHVAIQHCSGNLSNWLYSSPEPCVALRVLDSPKLPLMLSGAVNWAWYTFVGPIRFLQTLIAFCRANMCTSDGPLQHKTRCHLVKLVFAGSTRLECYSRHHRTSTCVTEFFTSVWNVLGCWGTILVSYPLDHMMVCYCPTWDWPPTSHHLTVWNRQ